MANANIAVVTTNKTFDEWRVATNDLITDRNTLRNSNYVKDDGDFTIANGKVQISRAAGGTTLINDNDALVGGLLTTTDLTVIDDVIIGGNATMISANARLTVNNNVYTRNLDSNSLITAANVIANGYVTVLGTYRDSQNNILNVNSVLYMANSGAINVGNTFSANGQINANRVVGTGLYVAANVIIDGNTNIGANISVGGNASILYSTTIGGNLSVTDNGTFSKNLNVTNWISSGNLNVAFQTNLSSANIITANIATLNVNAAGSIANVANLRVANSNTVNAYIKTLTVGDTIGSLNVTNFNVSVINVSTLLNATAANIGTLEVTSLTVKDPISAPSESDSSSYRLRVAQTTRADGSFGVRLGSAANGNAWITFDTTAGNVWRLTSNSTQGIYSTILTVGNVVTSVTSTSTTDPVSASSVKTAYDQATSAREQANTARDRANIAFTNAGLAFDAANAAAGGGAYGAANAAANTVAVYANNSLVFANANINFNNTATVNVLVTQNTTNRRANIEFSVNSSSITVSPSLNSALSSINTTFSTVNTTFNTINSTFSTVNTSMNTVYTAANSAANTVRVSANGGSTLSARQLNFVNSATVTVSVTSNPDGSNANVAFTSIGGGSGTPGGSNRQIQFNNNGSFGGTPELIYDSANQRFGVGTTTPTTRLDISQSGSSGTVVDTARIFADAAGTAEVRTLFGTFANPVSAAIGAHTTSSDSAALKFYTESGGVLSERFRINPDGAIGIGVASPYKKLEVVGGGISVGPLGAGTSQLGIELGDLLTTVPSSQIRGIIGVGDSSIGLAGDMIYQPRSDVNASHRFAIKGSEVFRIQHDGRVGIGISSPRSKLDVNDGSIIAGDNGVVLSGRGSSTFPSSGIGYFQLAVNNSDATNGGIDIQTLNNGSLRLSYKIHEQGASSYHAWSVAGTERMRLQSTGRLNIASATGSVGFNVGSLSTPDRGNLYYDTDGSGWRFQIGKVQSGTFIAQMTFNDNGVVNIPTALTVGGTSVLRHVSSGYIGGNVFVSSVAPTAGAVGDIWIEI